jgi:bifunctional enzyme CysN/CysC
VIDTAGRTVVEATDEIERMLAKTSVLFDDIADLAANI